MIVDSVDPSATGITRSKALILDRVRLPATRNISTSAGYSQAPSTSTRTIPYQSSRPCSARRQAEVLGSTGKERRVDRSTSGGSLRLIRGRATDWMITLRKREVKHDVRGHHEARGAEHP